MKRICSLLLVLVMLLGAAPVATFAEPSYQTGDHIQFGNYPQSRETNSSIISALNSKAGSTDNWTSYGYYSGTGSLADGLIYCELFVNDKRQNLACYPDDGFLRTGEVV